MVRKKTVHKYISGNSITNTFKCGWDKADEFLKIICIMGIVTTLNGKLPRAVIPTCLGDLSPEVIEILNRYGYTEEQILETFNTRGEE